ncbi:TUS1 [Candida theae]|uniref:TUS1 n=1 Tax=Candida theae TaxID=1198502 RepID=A0AAD5BGR9_9ASCO|nr:TUS1 [Candida theae]KAI5961558.1 TUS1 [Candida theae]
MSRKQPPRRKPPPSESDPSGIYGSGSSSAPISSQGQYTSSSRLTHSTISGIDPSVFTPVEDQHNTTEISFDESFTSYDSPKPKGPKEIWEYDDSTTPTKSIYSPPPRPTHASIQISRILPQRSYQQMSRSRSNPNVSKRTSFDSDTVDNPDKIPPYPTRQIEDFLDDDFDSSFAFDVDSPSQMRTRAIIEETVNTTSPKLYGVPNLSTRDSQSTFPTHQRQSIDSSFIDSEESSPTHTPSRRLSVYSHTQSRSPSPKRINQSDYFERPVLMLNDHVDTVEERQDSLYSQHHPASPYRVVSDNPFYDDEEIYKYESPVTDYFDYSFLPELPPSRDISSTTSSTAPFPPLPTPPPPPLSTGPPPPLPKKLQELPPLPLDLPQLPFSSSALQVQHFEVCSKIWSLSNLFQWCCKLQVWLSDSTISKPELLKAITRLIAFHRSDLSLDVVMHNSQTAFNSLLQTQAIEVMELHRPNGNEDRSVVLFNDKVYVNGILPELSHCYTTISHTREEEMTCYSTICPFSRMMNLERKMRSMNIKDIVLATDWAAHWRLTVDDLRDLDTNMIKRQSLIFDLLRYEQTFIQRARCFVDVVAPSFVKAAKGFFGSNSPKIKVFEEEVIKTGASIVKIHQKQLFEPLLKVLIAEGKFIKNVIEIVNIYTDWAKEVRPYLVTYMNNMPMIEELLGTPSLKTYVDERIGQLPQVKELKVNVPILFMSTFNSRYQQIPLQLLDIQKRFDEHEPEYFLLKQASDEIKKLGSKINDSKKLADNVHALEQLKSQLYWKSNLRQRNLNLGSINRKLICRGDLTRRSDLKITSQVMHVILLDNIILITERLKTPKPNGAQYKICEDPIPIDFLSFEDRVIPPSTIKLSSSPITKTPHQEDEDSKYGVKLRYAGRPRHTYLFLCKTEREKNDWIDYLTTARVNMNKRLFNTKIYRAQALSSSCFAYEYNNRITKLPVVVSNDTIHDLCLDAVAKTQKLGLSDIYSTQAPRNRVVQSSVQCCAKFEYMDLKFTFVGLHSGMYCCESKSRWKKVLSGGDFSKIHVDTNIGLVVTLSDKALRYYFLRQVLDVYTGTRKEIVGTSLSKDPVLFFSMKMHKNIPMLFFAKKKLNVTSFKVLIPETDNNGVFSRFKDDRKFYIEAECFGISIFNSSFALHTDKGFEIMELDKLMPRSVPDLPFEIEHKKLDHYSRKQPGTTLETIKKLVTSSNSIPMGMFKLNNNTEFLLVYSEFAIFINKSGSLSRETALIFDFKAQSVDFVDNHLLLVREDILEVLSISDFVKGSNDLVQVVTGKGIHLISEGRDVSLVMANPLVPGLQLLFDLVPT